MPPRPDRLAPWIVLLIVGLGFACYANTLHGPFQLDDWHNIAYNGHIRLHSLSPAGLAEAAFKSPIPSRPVANLSFALNYLLHGYRLPGYHLTNIAIHCLTGILLFSLIRGTFATPALKGLLDPGRTTRVAGLSALLWLLNPTHTQSVSYIVQRMNSLAAMFYILSLLLYLKARTGESRQPAWLAGCLVSGLLAAASKEIAVTLPAALFLYEWYFLQNLDREWLKRKLPLLVSIVVLATLAAWFYLDRASILAAYQKRDFTLGQRLLTEPRVVCRYLLLAFLPWPGWLNLDHDFPVSTGLLQPPATLPALLALAGLLAAAFITAPRQRLLSFGIVWFFLNLLVESTIIPLEIIFDHRTYLPLMLVWPPLLALAWQLPERKRTVALAAALFLLAVFALWTVQRNQVWASEVALNRDIVQKNPASGRAHANFGRALLRAEQEAEGLRELELARTLAPNHPIIFLNFGYYHLERNRFPEAIDNFRKVIELAPTNNSVHNHLARAYLGNRQYREAIVAARLALSNPAYRDEALLTLGLASSETGDFQTAISSFEELARRNPENGRYRFNLGRALEKTGQRQAALRKYEEALAIASEEDKKFIGREIETLRGLLRNGSL